MARPPREAVIHIDPSAFIAPGAVVLGDVTLGPNSSVWYGCVLRGDMAAIVVGENSNVQDGTIVHVDEGKPARIGARVGIGHRAVIHGCTIDDECLVGMGSVLLNDVHVESGSVIAAGALVTEGTRVPAGSLVMGVPARVVRAVDQPMRDRIRRTWEHYVGQAARHRSGAYTRWEPRAAL